MIPTLRAGVFFTLAAVCLGQSRDAEFGKLADRYYDELVFRFDPVQGTSAGFHQYDPLLPSGSRAEIELQIIQIDQDLISEVAKDMREVEAKIGESIERKVTAEDQLKRVDIRAPQAGFVHQLAVHTVGGVITAADPIMLIVPAKETLVVEVKVSPQDIDQIKLDQHAILKFTTFNQRTTPEINGFVSRLSADVTTEQRTGIAYYTARIAITPDELARLGQVTPGRPISRWCRMPTGLLCAYAVA